MVPGVLCISLRVKKKDPEIVLTVSGLINSIDDHRLYVTTSLNRGNQSLIRINCRMCVIQL